MNAVDFSFISVGMALQKHKSEVNKKKSTDHYMCFSIPYEENWRAYINGNHTETFEGMGGFLLVPLPSGTCDIEIRYTPPLLYEGILCSVLSFLLSLHATSAFKNQLFQKHRNHR